MVSLSPQAAVCCSVVHPNVVSTFHYDIKPVHIGASSLGAGSPGFEIEMSGGSNKADYKLFLVQELCFGTVSDLLSASFFHWKASPSGASGAGAGAESWQIPKPKLHLILCLLENTAEGMIYIHSKSLLHGDLKPLNIVVKRDRKHWGYTAKITDFVSRLVFTSSHLPI